MNVRAIFVLLAALAVAPASASAHDLWLTIEDAQPGQRVVVNYGHPDDRPPALADKIVALSAITSDGTTSLRDGLAPAERRGAIVVLSKAYPSIQATLFAAHYDNGFWVKTSDGFINATRRSAPSARESVWSGKFAKAVSGAGAPYSRVLGHDLEIVPLSDPARVSPGSPLRVRVLFHGKPLAGAQVERGDGVAAIAEADIPRFTTNADGVADVPLPQAGAYLLVVDHRVTPSATPDQADADLFNATLWFRNAPD